MRALVATVGILVAGACAGGSADAGEAPGGAADGPVVARALATAPVAPGLPGAAYVSVAGLVAGDVLTSVVGAGVERVELHRSTADAGRTSMRHVDTLVAAPDGTLAMEPGGVHAMLFGVSDAVLGAGEVELILRFRSAGELQARARIVRLVDLEDALHGGHE